MESWEPSCELSHWVIPLEPLEPQCLTSQVSSPKSRVALFSTAHTTCTDYSHFLLFFTRRKTKPESLNQEKSSWLEDLVNTKQIL